MMSMILDELQPNLLLSRLSPPTFNKFNTLKAWLQIPWVDKQKEGLQL